MTHQQQRERRKKIIKALRRGLSVTEVADRYEVSIQLVRLTARLGGLRVRRVYMAKGKKR